MNFKSLLCIASLCCTAYLMTTCAVGWLNRPPITGPVVSKNFTPAFQWLQMMQVGDVQVPIWHEYPNQWIVTIRDAAGEEASFLVEEAEFHQINPGDVMTEPR